MKFTLNEWNIIKNVLEEKRNALIAGYKLVEGNSNTSVQLRRDLEHQANEIHKILVSFEYEKF